MKINTIKKQTAVFSLLCGLFLIAITATAGDVDNCIECHSVLHEEITETFVQGVHAKSNLSCVDCHGGDASKEDEDEAMDPKRGFVGVPAHADQPNFCGKCHSDPVYMGNYNASLPTDQVDKYWTSEHGLLLKKGDNKVAVCTGCHGVHGILPPDLPKSKVFPVNVPATCGACHSDEEYMAEYDIPTHQYAQYVDSSNVHGFALLHKRDLSAPACNDCHGNHGAHPPGSESVALVCVQCHSFNGKLYLNSPHKEAFEGFEVPACAFCHQIRPTLDDPHGSIHTIVSPTHKLAGTDEKAVCSQCHAEDEVGWNTASAISSWRDSLEYNLEAAHKLLEDVEQRGFEISDAKWALENDVKQAKMKLRTMTHSFNMEKYQESYMFADSVLQAVLNEGYNAEAELGGRYVYYVVITIFILLFAVLLAVKIKSL